MATHQERRYTMTDQQPPSTGGESSTNPGGNADRADETFGWTAP